MFRRTHQHDDTNAFPPPAKIYRQLDAPAGDRALTSMYNCIQAHMHPPNTGGQASSHRMCTYA